MTDVPHRSENVPTAIIVMGVAGSGKSSVGETLAAALGYRYIEGDSLHPAANIERMSQGIPLTDDDRWPWLQAIGQHLHAGSGQVVSCSALKVIYRDYLRQACGPPLAFVYLDGTRALLQTRMTQRTGHFMPPGLLDSQLATLEVPTGEPGVVTVEIDQPVDVIVAQALVGLTRLEFLPPAS